MKLILAGLFFIAMSAQAVPVDDVRIEGEGINPDQVLVLRNLSGFLPGDEFDQLKNERAITKFLDLYQAKGYARAKISHTFEKNPATRKSILTYRFQLGDPLKFALVDVMSRTEALPPDLQARLIQSMDMKPNELLDRDRLKDMKRSIEAGLLAQNFIDSRVIDTQTESLGNNVFRVIFTVDLGQRVIFSTSGNQYFSRNELASVINDQRKVGLGRDYINALINRLYEHYIEYGFRFVQITPYTFESSKGEPRKVIFEIKEGPRVMIRQLIFDGPESFTSSQLEKIFFQNAPDRVQARIYSEKMVESSAQAMVDALKKMGYLSAKLIAIKTESAPRSAVDIRIFLTEGVQTKVQSLDFTGNRVFSSDMLKLFTGLREERPLSLSDLEEGLENIKREYRNLGYLDVKISNENLGTLISYSERNQFAFINIEIDEGTQWFYSGAHIFGTEKTKNEVVEREIRLKLDEPISEKKLLETEDRLRRLGIFGQVALELMPGENDPKKYKELKVSIVESIPGNMGVGAGFRNDLGIRLFGEVTYANLWGLNHASVFNVSTNRRLSNFHFLEYRAAVGYVWPWFTWGETTLRPNLSLERRQYIQFDAQTVTFSASLERKLLEDTRLFGSLTYSIEQIRQFNSPDTTQDKGLRIGSITPALRLDLRDHPLTPKRGFYATTSFEYANSFLGSQTQGPGVDPVNYGRLQTRVDLYFDFIPRTVWYVSARGGWLKNFANAYGQNFSIPLIKQFALGGINSMRGYLEQEINVQADDKFKLDNYNRRVQNFMTYVNYRTQLDYYTTPNLSFGPFLDAGNLNVDQFTFGALQYGTGLGLRYMTPVGPVNFDWGFKLFPKPNKETNVFYFSLGVN